MSRRRRHTSNYGEGAGITVRESMLFQGQGVIPLTNYFSPVNSGGTGIATPPTAVDGNLIFVAQGGNIKSLEIDIQTASVTGTFVYTLYIQGVASACVVTIAMGNTFGLITGLNIAVTQGQSMYLKLTGTSVLGPGRSMTSLRLDLV